MKKVLYVVGAGLAVGAAAAVFYLLINKKAGTYAAVHGDKGVDDKCETESNEFSKEAFAAKEKSAYDSAVESIYSGHRDAAAIMSDSVKAIHENIKVSESTNDELDEVSAELDRMISED